MGQAGGCREERRQGNGIAPSQRRDEKSGRGAIQKTYGFEVEVFTARASAAVRRMATNSKPGAPFRSAYRRFFLHRLRHVGRGHSRSHRTVASASWVKDPKQWWGGHLWVDNAKRFIYMFQAYLPESIWYNTDLAKLNEIRSYDEFLDPKWKGKIGFLDRRTPGAETRAGRLFGRSRGKSILKNLRHKNYISAAINACLRKAWPRDESPSRSVTFYSYAPFLKAGLPIKALPSLKRGLTAPAAAAIWRSLKRRRIRMAQDFRQLAARPRGTGGRFQSARSSTPRLDVDNRWLRESGTMPAKDAMSVNDFLQIENQSEENSRRCANPRPRLPTLS